MSRSHFIIYLLSLSLAYSLCSPHAYAQQDAGEAPIRKATRQNTIANAKNMVVRTRNATYYYLVSFDSEPVMHLEPGTVNIGGTDFARSDIRSIRFRSLPHVFLDEDSTTYNKAFAFDRAALALRRSFNLGQWNSLVLPFDLTGEQIRYAFGDDAKLAQPRAVTEGEQTTVEFTTIDLQTDDVVLRANYHYLLQPTREPDIDASSRMYSFITERPYGPIYFIPNVTKAANQSPRLQQVQSSDATYKVRFHGSYMRLDGTEVVGSSVRNKRVAPGMYYLNDEGKVEFSQDSLTVQAFRSWIHDITSETQTLRFYIDGIGEDITALTDAIATPHMVGEDAQSTIYTLSGQRIANRKSANRSLQKGIYIVNGRKVAIK